MGVRPIGKQVMTYFTHRTARWVPALGLESFDFEDPSFIGTSKCGLDDALRGGRFIETYVARWAVMRWTGVTAVDVKEGAHRKNAGRAPWRWKPKGWVRLAVEAPAVVFEENWCERCGDCPDTKKTMACESMVMKQMNKTPGWFLVRVSTSEG